MESIDLEEDEASWRVKVVLADTDRAYHGRDCNQEEEIVMKVVRELAFVSSYNIKPSPHVEFEHSMLPRANQKSLCCLQLPAGWLELTTR
eukprot:scaffold3034_cov110-Skeletonema_dohrnii-CCMP3373.AAC.2